MEEKRIREIRGLEVTFVLKRDLDNKYLRGIDQMQFDSYLRLMAGALGFFGIIFIAIGIVCLRANRRAGLSEVSRGELSLEQLKKLAKEKTFLISGLALVVLFILGLVAPWLFNLAERQVFEGYYWVSIYAAVAQGMVVSLFVSGCIATFKEHRLGN